MSRFRPIGIAALCSCLGIPMLAGSTALASDHYITQPAAGSAGGGMAVKGPVAPTTTLQPYVTQPGHHPHRDNLASTAQVSGRRNATAGQGQLRWVPIERQRPLVQPEDPIQSNGQTWIASGYSSSEALGGLQPKPTNLAAPDLSTGQSDSETQQAAGAIPALASAVPAAATAVNSTTTGDTASRAQPHVDTQPPAREASLASLERPLYQSASSQAELMRHERAARVSARTLNSGQPPANSPLLAVTPIGQPVGWQAVEQRLTHHIQACEALVRRRAFLSAQQEAQAGALYLMQVIDQHLGSRSSEPAWQSALIALDEAAEFSYSDASSVSQETIRQLIGAHHTPVLKRYTDSNIAARTAAAYYRQYAIDRLIAAAQTHPWASEVFYAVGRAYQAQADVSSPAEAEEARQRAVTFLQAATDIDPSNALALNQLGFVLLKLDRPDAAKNALVQSLQIQPSLACLENLIEASQRLEDDATYHWAMSNYQRIRGPKNTTTNIPHVVEVNPQAFAAWSPPVASGPVQGAAPRAQAATHVATQPAGYTPR